MRGEIEWVVLDDDGKPVLYGVPPETTAWQRSSARQLGAFVPADEL